MRILLSSILIFAAATTFSQNYEPENLGEAVNSADGDNGPVISPDGKTLYFWSTRGGATCWYSDLDANGAWTAAKPMPAPFNSKNEKVCSVSPDGNKILAVYMSGSTGYCIASKTKDGWSEFEKLNIKDYPHSRDNNYMMKASLSNSGNILVYPLTITIPESKWRTDLFVSFLQPDGSWSAPLDLGTGINTSYSEITPFLAADNTTLYFSRNSSNDQDFDVYRTKRLDSTWKNWSPVEKLGGSVNNEAWNADYNIPASGDFAYMASSKNPLKGTYTDLIKIRLRDSEKPAPATLIHGKVINSKTNLPLDAKIEYEVLADGKKIGTAQTNPTTGEYKIVLPYGTKYGMLATAQGFLTVSDNIDLTEVKEYKEIKKDLYLVPFEVGETIRINNLFFETAKAEIKSESFPELHRLLEFLVAQPAVSIQINGHTDNVGADASNNALSQSRANAVKEYMVKNKIDAARILVKGFGKTKPVASNDTEEGKQMNRRVEFVILKK
jgi:OmpA-OmpF porin, OOP family